ncbi:conserved hypothetical protein [Aeropyrum pernix]|uniref:Glycosidase n=2 Tax=Aeropyrum pernix TaxID=56636 RepID=A0A401HB88_AERPX|nr:conserved hypothetical protein [Aeropyrum pernix]
MPDMVNMRRSLAERFKEAPGSAEAERYRRRHTVDIARRIGYIRPENVELERGSTRRVVSFFNSTLRLAREGLEVYGRVVVGYYKYVSLVASLRIDLEDISSGHCSWCEEKHTARPEILPGDWIDFWGAEDPRYTSVNGHDVLTYTGRTLAYYSSSVGQTFPVVAVRRGPNGEWAKEAYITLEPDEAPLATSIKNAFILSHRGILLAFYRVHDVSGRFHLLAGISEGLPEGPISPLAPKSVWRIMDPAPFEEKIGWATPVNGYKGGSLLVLLHAVDTEQQVYRVLAAELDLEGDELVLKAVTPEYIMEPSTLEERFGDRPYTIFPCGAWLVDGDIIVSYGAADTATGLASIPLDVLEERLDKGRTGY